MNFKIETIPRFEKDVKKLKKKFPKIKNDLLDLIATLSSNPETGINFSRPHPSSVGMHTQIQLTKRYNKS